MKVGFSKKPHIYIPAQFKGESAPPTFTIRRLSPLELMDISEKYSDANETIELGGIENPSEEEKTVKVSMSTINKMVKSKYAVLREALSGWENVDDEEGAPIEFSADNIECLDQDLINELSDVAQGVVTAEEAKNSESSSS